MFGNREVHRKLSGTRGYAAGRLAEISESLGQLAKVMKNSGEDPGLSREDGIAALESAASMVCGSCDRCGMKQECLEDQDGENYFLYYLLRSFEKKGALEYPDMPREFLDRCRKKTDYLQELNRSLGRSTMNLAWKNRFLESRDAVMLQFEEMAGIFAAKHVDLTTIEEDPERVNDASTDGRSFAVGGGVAKAVVNVIQHRYPGREVKVTSSQGLRECRKMMQEAVAGKYPGYLLEGMACPGGCVAGAGTMQPIKKSQAAVGLYARQAKHKTSDETEHIKELDKLVD